MTFVLLKIKVLGPRTTDQLFDLVKPHNLKKKQIRSLFYLFNKLIHKLSHIKDSVQ